MGDPDTSDVDVHGERRPGPPSTLDDLRERLIEAGTRALLAEGVTIGLDAVRVSDAIEATGAARASAYRALAHDELEPQELLRREVLLRVLQRDSRGENLAVVERAIADEFAEFGDLPSPDDAPSRARLHRALIRASSAASFRNVAGSRERAILMAAYGAASSRDLDSDAWQREALCEGERELSRQFGQLYAESLRTFGLRLRPGITIEHFAIALASLLEGLALRARFRDDLDGIVLPSDPGGEDEEWTIFALAAEGIVGRFCEPVPDAS